jgi:hypothetical protein
MGGGGAYAKTEHGRCGGIEQRDASARAAKELCLGKRGFTTQWEESTADAPAFAMKPMLKGGG